MAERAAIIALAALTFALAGCGSSSPGLAPGAPLEIGYLASLTGYCDDYARQYVQGARLAVATIDARGGVLGHELRLVVRDDEGKPGVGVEQARELVGSEQHVRYLAGTCSSTVARSVAELVTNPSHVLYVAGVADPAIFADGPEGYAFDTIPTATVEGRNAAAYARAHARWKRIAVIAEDYSYGYLLTAAFERAMAGSGQAGRGGQTSSGQAIVSVAYLPSGGRDFGPYIEKLKAERPDVVYSTAITGDAVTLAEEGLARGLFAKTKVFGIMDYGTLAALPRAPVGVEGYTYYPSAAIYRTPFARELQSLGTTVANGGAAGDGFNQIEVIAQGIEKAGSTDPAKVRDGLGGATVQTVQGDVRIHRCDHELAVPIAMGPVAPPTRAQPFPHFAPLTLVDTSRYFEC